MLQPERRSVSSAVTKIPTTIVVHGKTDPRMRVGGVETFARTLEGVFEEVRYSTSRSRYAAGAPVAGGGADHRTLPIICDNATVLDWPSAHPVIGFQHGVAAVKYRATRNPGHWLLARRQRRAAARPNTMWVACATWIGESFGRLYGNAAEHVIYHPIDTARFDGQLDNERSRLVLHDARTRHKGERLVRAIAETLPEWRFEPLACAPDRVPDRMRQARAFLHLSRYEGNSIVCLEAMAMDLPCLFTRVGLMRDRDCPVDVFVVEPDEVFAHPRRAIDAVRTFLGTLEDRVYRPRQWILQNATFEVARSAWRIALRGFAERTGWQLNLG